MHSTKLGDTRLDQHGGRGMDYPFSTKLKCSREKDLTKVLISAWAITA